MPFLLIVYSGQNNSGTNTASGFVWRGLKGSSSELTLSLWLLLQVIINSTITPNMTFTKTSQKFGQWADSRANTVFGLGFSSELQLTKVCVPSCSEMGWLDNLPLQ